MTHDATEERIRALAPGYDDGDWADVLARAGANTAVGPSAPPAGTRRAPHPAVLAAATAVLASILGLAWWLREDPAPTLVERALAAVSAGPVLHAVLEVPTAATAITADGREIEFSVVDLATGTRKRTVTTRTELWWDRDRRLLRGRISTDGAVQWEWLQSPRGTQHTFGRDRRPGEPPFVDPALAPFPRGYARALEEGAATRSVTEVREGRTVEWLRFRLPGGENSSEIAIDAETGRPLYLRTICPRCTSPPRTHRIAVLEGIERSAADFTAPQRRARSTKGRYADGWRRAISLGEASKRLGTTALWAGPTVGRLRLLRIEYLVRSRHTGLPTTRRNQVGRGHGLVFVYGVGDARRPSPGSTLGITQTTDWRFGPGNFDNRSGGRPFTLSGGPVPPEGELALSGLGPSYGWSAQLRKRDLFVEIHAPTRALALHAAQALTPVPRR